MTKQMTTLDRARVSRQQKQSTSAEAPATESVDPEKVCQESIDDPLETCTTPNDPAKPTVPVDVAA